MNSEYEYLQVNSLPAQLFGLSVKKLYLHDDPHDGETQYFARGWGGPAVYIITS